MKPAPFTLGDSYYSVEVSLDDVGDLVFSGYDWRLTTPLAAFLEQLGAPP